MALSKLTYVDNVTVIPASNLNAIQDEVIANGTNVASAKSEVENIRVGADGTTYASAGDAVRGQIGDVQNYISTLSDSGSAYDTSDNLAGGLTLNVGYYANGGAYSSNANFSYLTIDVSNTPSIHIDGTLHIYTTTQFNALGIFCDANGNYLTSILAITGASPTFPIEIDVPANAVTLQLNTDYKASDYPSSLPSGLVCYPWRTVTKKIKIVAGVIRNSGNGWEYINDAGHEPFNLNAISVDTSGRIVIEYNFTASKVLSLVATPDETFARQYSIGGSVGLDKTLFNVYSTPKIYGGLVTITNDVVNINNSSFTSGSLNTSTGEIRLYHPTLSALLGKEKFNISASAKNYNVSLGSQGNDYVSIFLKDNSGTIIKTFTSENIYVTRFINSVFVDANNITDAGGNFWILGVMEM